MRLRMPAFVAVAAALGWGAAETAHAQPLVPTRPGFSSFGGLAGGGGAGGAAYYGLYRPSAQLNQIRNQMAVNNQLLSSQIQASNQNLANFQTAVLQAVNPNLPRTGRGSVYQSLGHWYPTLRYGGGGGGFGGYGLVSTSSAPLVSMGGGGGAISAGAGGIRR